MEKYSVCCTESCDEVGEYMTDEKQGGNRTNAILARLVTQLCGATKNYFTCFFKSSTVRCRN